jgi:uncharacterized membrane protein YfcA
MKRFHVAGVLSALVSVGGLLSHPEILNLLPEKYAVVMSAVGVVLQAITKGVQHGSTQMIDREAGIPVTPMGRMSKQIPIVVDDDVAVYSATPETVVSGERDGNLP